MENEQCLVQSFDPTCNPNPNPILHSHGHLHLSSLSTAHSLLLNPSTSIATAHSTVESLLLSLPHLSSNHTSLSLALSVLAQSASRHPSLTQSIIASIRSLINHQGPISSAVLSALISIARSLPSEDGFDILASLLDENLVLSLASSRVYKARSRILQLLVFYVEKLKGSGISLTDEVIFRVFLGFTHEAYPILRKDALDGLFMFLTVAGAGADICVADCCLNRALSLMGDDDEDVRSAAVRMVGLCGKIIAEKEKGVDKSEKMDTTFTQVDINLTTHTSVVLICCMARDMNVRVRVETFKALGKLKLVSVSVLMQSLSKKILGAKNGGKSLVKIDKESKPSFSCAAGAYIHGIEDEFYEVRQAACRSLGIHAVLSIKFADDAINLLMDLMNDDVEVVRLEALDSVFLMAARECLNVHEKHMHMFLGLLTDVSSSVRHGARKTLQSMKLPKFEIFKSTVNELIANLEKYPEEEEDIFFALFSLGKNHQRFSLSLAKHLGKQMEQTSKVDLALDKPSMAATLVVCIASPLSENETVPNTPAVLFSYAIPLLGRISRALEGAIDQDFLLTFLLDRTHIKWKSQDLISKFDITENNEALMQSVIEFISKSIGDAWSLIKRSNGDDAKRILRSCTQELEVISLDAPQSASTTLEFLSKYIIVLRLVSELWCSFELRKSTIFHIRNHHILLEKLDSSLRRILYSFTGCTKEVECHILELNLLSDVFTLSLTRTHSYNYLKNLCAKISHLEAISCLSDFTKEVKRLIDERSSDMINLHGLLELFEFRELEFVKEMKPIKAELEVAGNNSENPLTFVPGLPVGIGFCITVHNASSTDRLWLRMFVGGKPPQYMFLDICKFEGNEEVRKYTHVVPFYGTPKVSSFEIRICVVMECLSEYYKIDREKEGRPKYEVTELSLESIVCFSSAKNG